MNLKYVTVVAFVAIHVIFGQALQYYTVDPNVVFRGDTSTKINIRVATDGQDITRVHIVAPIETDLFDDGTNGDEVANDGIYSIDGVDHLVDVEGLFFGGTHNSRGHFNLYIENNDASIEEHWLRIGIVHENESFEVTQLANDIYATQYALFIVDEDGDLLDITGWPLGNIKCGKENFGVTQKLYSVLPDSFDFIITMPTHPIHKPENYAENVPYFVRAKNEIQNIGIDIFDNTADFGSAGRLMGTIYHSWGYGSILDHEIGHAWCADIGESLNLCKGEDSGYTNHWNKYSDIAGQMAYLLQNPNAAYGAGHLFDNGDGTWRIEREPTDNMPYSMLDLYCMGLVSKEDVPPIHILNDIDDTDHLAVTAGSVETITIDDIIADEGGERIPLVTNSQKEFNVAFIAVKHKEFTDADYAYYSNVSKYFASEEQGFPSLTTFYTATGGRARLDPTLHIEGLSTKKANELKSFSLKQNFPNPFNPKTSILYDINKESKVKLTVYDLLGSEIVQLVNQIEQPGSKVVQWDGRNKKGELVNGGVYLYKLEIGSYTETKKMVLLK